LEQITSENYVEHAMHTDCTYDAELYARMIKCARLQHAAMGLATEAGEFVDMIKKHIYYGKALDVVNAKEELSDCSWYIALALNELNTTMNEVLTLNINKLKLRYPAKFSSEDAINRDVVAERELLERKVEWLTGDGVDFKPGIFLSVNESCKPSFPQTANEIGLKIADDIIEAAKDSKRGLPDFHIDDKTGGIVNEVLPTNKRQYKGIRTAEWLEFAYKVADHIENYTIPQYGDKGKDQATGWSIDHCIEQTKKYANRFGKNQRPGQEMLDFMKGCHYLQIAATKFVESQESLCDSCVTACPIDNTGKFLDKCVSYQGAMK